MCNDNCIYCEERQLTYDLDGATKMNTLQVEVIAELTAQVARLKAGIAQLKMTHDIACNANWGYTCRCNADAHNAAVDALFGDGPPALVGDDFGNEWGPCVTCGSEMQIVRPGKAQCPVCQ